MSVSEILLLTLLPVWTLICLLVGLSIGFRVRGGQAPLAPLYMPKVQEERKPTPSVKPQVPA